MGFFGFIGSAIMGSSIVQGALAVGAAIVSSVMAMTIPQVLLCVYICVLIAKELGILSPEAGEKDVEELGDKVIQAREKGIKPENYETYEEYMKAIENFKVDPVKSSKISLKEKLADGIGLLSTLISIKSPDCKSILEMVTGKIAPKLAGGEKSPSLMTGIIDDKMKETMMSIAKNYFATMKSGGAGITELAEFVSGKNDSPAIYDAKMKADKELNEAISEFNKNGK